MDTRILVLEYVFYTWEGKTEVIISQGKILKQFNLIYIFYKLLNPSLPIYGKYFISFLGLPWQNTLDLVA